MSRLVWFILGGVVSLIGAGVAGVFMREGDLVLKGKQASPDIEGENFQIHEIYQTETPCSSKRDTPNEDTSAGIIFN